MHPASGPETFDDHVNDHGKDGQRRCTAPGDGGVFGIEQRQQLKGRHRVDVTGSPVSFLSHRWQEWRCEPVLVRLLTCGHHASSSGKQRSMLLFSIVRSRPVEYSPNRRMRVLGCMSGTSVDGIDVACADLELAGDELLCRFRGLASTPFDVRLQERIVAALPPGLPGAGELCQLHAELGHAYAAAFAAAREDLAEGEADLAVMHGQTFYHWVDDDGRALGTLQLGNSSAVAERLGVPVISDLRSRDIAAGGQGAPLVSMFDALLLAGRTGLGAAVNLGGIANLADGSRRRRGSDGIRSRPGRCAHGSGGDAGQRRNAAFRRGRDDRRRAARSADSSCRA